MFYGPYCTFTVVGVRLLMRNLKEKQKNEMVDLSKTCLIFCKCQPGIEMAERAGAKVRATVYRDGYKNRPDQWLFQQASFRRLIMLYRQKEYQSSASNLDTKGHFF